MIKFFRKIRHDFLKAGKLKKYLIYAMGEIFLVMIGILLAFQLNAIVKNRENNAEEKRIPRNLPEHDLKDDIVLLDQLIDSANTTTPIMTALTVDKLDFINKMEAFIKDFNFQANDGTFNEAVSTGTMRLIKSDKLRGLVFKYYKEVENNRFLNEQSAFVNNHEITGPETYEKVVGTAESFARYNITLPLAQLNLENLIKDQKFMGSVFNRMASLQNQISSWRRLKKEAEMLSKEIRVELNSH